MMEEVLTWVIHQKAIGDPEAPNIPIPNSKDDRPVLHKGEEAVRALKKGMSPGVKKILTELVQAGKEA